MDSSLKLLGMTYIDCKMYIQIYNLISDEESLSFKSEFIMLRIYEEKLKNII